MIGAKRFRRLRVLDARLDEVDMAEALRFVEAVVVAAHPTTPAVIMAVNPEKVYALRADAELRAFAENADLLIPDGIGMVWAARVLHGVRMKRVAGADLMQALCEQAARRGHRIFLYGAREEINAGAASELQRRFPGLPIAGRANGFVADDDMAGLVSHINDSGANILFVALGSPRQERWIRTHAPDLRVSVIQGIGGTLDTIAGRVKRAPVLFQRARMEWFYRLVRQPGRAWRQRRLAQFVFLGG